MLQKFSTAVQQQAADNQAGSIACALDCCCCALGEQGPLVHAQFHVVSSYVPHCMRKRIPSISSIHMLSLECFLVFSFGLRKFAI